MKNERLILNKVKEYLNEEIAYLKKQENESNEVAKIDYSESISLNYKRDVRKELECLNDIIKFWEGA